MSVLDPSVAMNDGNFDDDGEECVEQPDGNGREKCEQDREVDRHAVVDPQHGDDVRAQPVHGRERQIDLAGNDHERQAEAHHRDRTEATQDAEEIAEIE